MHLFTRHVQMLNHRLEAVNPHMMRLYLYVHLMHAWCTLPDVALDRDPLEDAARQLLREKVGYPANKSMRRMDKAMGRHIGFTSRLLAGESRLRFDHVSELLRALQLDYATFLKELARRLDEGSGESNETDLAVERFFRSLDPQGVIRRIVRDEMQKSKQDE